MSIRSIIHHEHGPPWFQLSSSAAARDLVVTVLWISLLVSLIAQLVE